MKTIANIVHQNKFPMQILDNEGRRIYGESSTGFWVKIGYNENGDESYCENSKGLWIKHQYDENGNEIFYKHSDGIVEYNRP